LNGSTERSDSPGNDRREELSTISTVKCVFPVPIPTILGFGCRVRLQLVRALDQAASFAGDDYFHQFASAKGGRNDRPTDLGHGQKSLSLTIVLRRSNDCSR